MKHLFILLLLCFASTAGFATKIQLNKLKCTGDYQLLESFLRLTSDQHDVIPEPLKASCSVRMPKDMNKLPYSSYVIGIRMSDTQRHEEDTSNDYVKLDVGSAHLMISTEHVHLYQDEKKFFSCAVTIFQDESKPSFSTEKITYIQVMLTENAIVKVMTSQSDKWIMCGETQIKKPSKKKMVLVAETQMGMNIDITHVEINPETVPWKTRDSAAVTKEKVEHAEERIKVVNNAFFVEINKNKSNIRMIFVYVALLTAVVVFNSIPQIKKCLGQNKINRFRDTVRGHDHFC